MNVTWYGGPQDGEMVVLPEGTHSWKVALPPPLTVRTALESPDVLDILTINVPVEKRGGRYVLAWDHRRPR